MLKNLLRKNVCVEANGVRNVSQKLCRTAFACAADAQQALTTFALGLQAASVHEGTISPRPRYGKRGRPGQDTAPVQVVYQITGLWPRRSPPMRP